MSSRNLYFKRREIWWVSLGQNVGVETNGKNFGFQRPVLVIKVFNIHSALVAPISSKCKTGNYIVEFINISGEKNIVNLSQLKTISRKRFVRRVGEMNDRDFKNICYIIKRFI